MAKNGFRVLDSDIHIIEPPDLWERYIDAPFRHQAPRGFADWVLDLRIEIDGKLMPANVNYSADARGRSAQRDRERFRPFHERGWSPEAQLDAMDQEGIDAGVRSEEHTSELQSRLHLVCRLLLEKKKK